MREVMTICHETIDTELLTQNTLAFIPHSKPYNKIRTLLNTQDPVKQGKVITPSYLMKGKILHLGYLLLLFQCTTTFHFKYELPACLQQ